MDVVFQIWSQEDHVLLFTVENRRPPDVDVQPRLLAVRRRSLSDRFGRFRDVPAGVRSR